MFSIGRAQGISIRDERGVYRSNFNESQFLLENTQANPGIIIYQVRGGQVENQTQECKASEPWT